MFRWQPSTDTLLITPVQTEEELNMITELYQQANPQATFDNIFKWTKKIGKILPILY
ncbi:MAG: hypothetical protein ACTSR7_06105 [Promethearchaeota archaeon]